MKLYKALTFILLAGFLHVLTDSQAQHVGIRHGSQAPELAFPSPDGEIIKLSDLKGNFVVLDFWASWCGPCRRKNPEFVALYNRFKDSKFIDGKIGFDFYGYSLDRDKNSWVNAIERDGLTWPNHTSDLKGWSAEGAIAYGVRGIPATLLIDPFGNIIMINPSTREIISYLEERLTE